MKFGWRENQFKSPKNIFMMAFYACFSKNPHIVLVIARAENLKQSLVLPGSIRYILSEQ